MSLPRKITIDTYDRRHEGAYGVVVEYYGQAPLLLEREGCDSSFKSCEDQVRRIATDQRSTRWCIVRLVPVEGNELLVLDMERLQAFKKEPNE